MLVSKVYVECLMFMLCVVFATPRRKTRARVCVCHSSLVTRARQEGASTAEKSHEKEQGGKERERDALAVLAIALFFDDTLQHLSATNNVVLTNARA